MKASEYSKTAIMDVRDACAMALRRVLEAIDREVAGQRIRFNHVFDEWPSFDDKFDPPAACVLPPQSWRYDDNGGTPKLLEDTVEPSPIPDVVPGETDPPAFGLFRTAEMMDDFTITVMGTTPAQRAMLKLAVEDAFQTPNVNMDLDGQKYGLLLDLPEYWDMTARASLISAENTDSEEMAARNLRGATLTVQVQAPKVQLGGVWPMAVTITKQILRLDGELVSTSVVTGEVPT